MFEIGLAIGKLIKESKIYTVIINANVNIKRFLFFIPIYIEFKNGLKIKSR